MKVFSIQKKKKVHSFHLNYTSHTIFFACNFPRDIDSKKLKRMEEALISYFNFAVILLWRRCFSRSLVGR